MVKTENPELSRLILNHLSDKYKLKQPREDIHLSTLVYCLAPDTQILTSDLRWEALSNLKIGDELIGVDENIMFGRGERRKSRITSVVALVPTRLPSYRITMTDGRGVVSSADHLWLSMPKWKGYISNQDKLTWRQTDKLTVGSRIRQYCPSTWKCHNNYDTGYLAGFLDGEGCLSKSGNNLSGLQMQFGQKPGPVLSHVLELINNLGVKLLSYKGSQSGVNSFGTTGLIGTYYLLGSVRPKRLLEKLRYLYNNPIGLQVTNPYAEIAAIEFIGERDLIALETKSRTFIAEGLISHNCLTRSFFDAHSAVEPTDEELMLFALGYGLQDVLTPPDAETPIYEDEGIIYRPDMLLCIPGNVGLQLIEVKTTRMSSKKGELPETWIEYIKGGCHIRKTNSYELVILYLMGNYAPPFPQISACRLEFEQRELDENWQYLINRRDVYQSHMADNTPPEPYMWCKVDDKGAMWECKNCRYKLQCSAISLLKKGD